MTAPIGFVGLGQMGGPMSRRLLAAGYELVVHDLRAEAVEDLVAAGAEAATSPAEVAGPRRDRAGQPADAARWCARSRSGRTA